MASESDTNPGMSELNNASLHEARRDDACRTFYTCREPSPPSLRACDDYHICREPSPPSAVACRSYGTC